MSFQSELIDALPAVRRYALTLLRNGDKADDLVQDVAVKALSKQHQYEEGTNLKAWLMTIMRNELYSQFRVTKRETVMSPEDISCFIPATLPDQEIKIYWNEFSHVFNDMQADQKRSLIYIAVEGFTYDEVADLEKVAPGTIKSRVHRAREFLKQRLELPDTDAISMGIINNDDNLRSGHSR